MLPEISIPPEISPDAVQTVLVDSSCRPEDRERTEEEIRQADVVCVIYAVDDIRSFHRLGTYWLPFVRTFGPALPIILVGNKIDVRGPDVVNDDLEDEILPLMSDFKEIETCVECSARTLINVAEAFYFAQKAVIHPTAPLYDSREHVLREECVRALHRLFRLSDRDRDGRLSDDELNSFQVRVYGTPLQREELETIKDILRESDDVTVDAQGITMAGFVYLHQLFIQRGRLETTWNALRAFGYNDELQLPAAVLGPALRVPKHHVVQLGPKGYQFFTELFTSFDRDRNGTLSWAQLDELFATTPENPWLPLGFPETTLTDAQGSVTLEGFLAQWAMTTALDHRVTLEYLAYLGYDAGPTPEALRVLHRTKARRDRDTFLCWVLGAPGSGKTGLCRAHVRRPVKGPYAPTLVPGQTVNSVPFEGRERYLVLREVVAHGGLERELLADAALLAQCDVVCYVYDGSDPNSFQHVVALREAHPALASLPGILVMTKAGLPAVEQHCVVAPAAYAAAEALVGPIPVSAKDGVGIDQAVGRAVQAAVRPAVKAGPGFSMWSLGLLATTAAVCVATAIVLHRHAQQPRK